ncbi:4188_t:CDS:2 [Entrophospora sp. SA101]|nr:4188_t:CDS:2 [Entrophospora sp. SA101]
MSINQVCFVNIGINLQTASYSQLKHVLEEIEGYSSESAADIFQRKATELMEKINKISDNSIDYSNPEKISELPFPFLGTKKPTDRFNTYNNYYFKYIGREKFEKILEDINKMKAGITNMSYYIYGTMGYGKSYILAAMTCYLLRTGRCVVYLPDCRVFVNDPLNYIKSALFLTFAYKEDEFKVILNCEKIEDIVRFCHSLGIYNRRLYFIVDQFNALDYDEGINAAFSNDVPICKKEILYDLINKMTSEHYIIKSASANNKSALYLQRKQLQEDKIVLIGGYTEV